MKDILEIMDSALQLPIEVEAAWDAEEATTRLDVRLAHNAFIAIWPRENTPEGIALELASEFERIALGIRETVQRIREDCDSPAVA